MTARTSIGTAPLSPLDTASVRRMFEERLAMSAEWEAARTLAPLRSMPVDEGEYPVPTSWVGLDLSTDAGALTEVSLEGTEYPELTTAFTARSFRCKRYMVGEFKVSRRRVRKLERESGIDYEAHALSLISAKASAAHYANVLTALQTTANYASGYQADGGNITSAAFNFIGLLESIGVKLEDSQSWAVGQPLRIVIGNDVWPYIGMLTQVKEQPGAGFAAQKGSTAAYADFFKTYLGDGVEIHRAKGNYLAADGSTVSRYLSGAIALYVPFSGGDTKSLISTIVSEGDDGAALLDVRDQEVPAFDGRVVYADAYYDVNIASNDAGYLAHTLLS